MSTRAIRVITLLSLLALGGLLGQTGAAAPAPSPAVADPADWPMLGHDIARTNFNPAETTINAGNVSQLVQRWQANIGSNGTPSSSSPVVSDGVLYIGSSAASGPNFFAFDAVGGSPVWAQGIGYRASCFNVGIGSTAAVSGTTVVVGADNASSNPAYYGVSTIDGTKVWTNTMNVGVSGFPWELPLNDYGRTYLGIASRCDNPSVRGEVRSADLTTGATLASQYFVNPGERGGGIWNSPVMSPDHSVLIVATGEDYSCSVCDLTRSMVSLDPITLQVLQHYQEGNPGEDLDYGTTPVVFHDAAGRGMVGANHKNGTFYAFVISNINAGPAWSRSIGVTVGAMPAYDPTFGNGGTLFAEGGGAQVYALDPATGANRWAAGSVTAGYAGNLAVANGLLFINTGSSLQIRSEVRRQPAALDHAAEFRQQQLGRCRLARLHLLGLGQLHQRLEPARGRPHADAHRGAADGHARPADEHARPTQRHARAADEHPAAADRYAAARHRDGHRGDRDGRAADCHPAPRRQRHAGGADRHAAARRHGHAHGAARPKQHAHRHRDALRAQL